MNPAQIQHASHASHAQTPQWMMAALLCVALAMPLPAQSAAESADKLGVLFYSPAERLDIARARSDSRPVAEQAPANLRLDGLVKRAGGKSTAWVNGQPVPEGSPIGRQPAPAIEKTGVAIAGRHLRIGESLDQMTGERSDLLPQGAVAVKRAP